MNYVWWFSKTPNPKANNKRVLWDYSDSMKNLLNAVYFLRAYQRIFWGDEGASTQGLSEISAREIVVLTPLLLLIVALGVYPSPLIDIIQPAVQGIIDTVQSVL